MAVTGQGTPRVEPVAEQTLREKGSRRAGDGGGSRDIASDPSETFSPARITERLEHKLLKPTRDELRPLTRFERFAFWWCDLFNRVRLLRRFASAFLWHVDVRWIRFVTKNLLRVDGLENIDKLDTEQPLVVCSNHRSFFDFYLVTMVMADRMGRMPDVVFPVRANFFYERPLGLFVNMLMAMFTMYPPVFRDRGKKEFNGFSIARTIEIARTPGTMVGYHPEGTRGKGPDPYELLPAQPGVGKIIYEARPQVLPVFINGLRGDDLPRQIRSNWDGTGVPIWEVFGEPMDLGRFYSMPRETRSYETIARHVLEEIGRLGQRERSLRAQS